MKKIRMVSDWVLLVAVIVSTSLIAIITFWTMFAVVHEGTVSDFSEMIQIRVFFGMLLVGYLIAVVATAPRFLCVIVLSEAAITVWIPFHRKKTFSYKDFRNVYCGKYFHGNIAGIGRHIWYIIITQKHLSRSELTKVNQIPNSEDVVKIRYSRKNCEKLQAILPPGHIRQLESAVSKIKD